MFTLIQHHSQRYPAALHLYYRCYRLRHYSRFPLLVILKSKHLTQDHRFSRDQISSIYKTGEYFLFEIWIFYLVVAITRFSAVLYSLFNFYLTNWFVTKSEINVKYSEIWYQSFRDRIDQFYNLKSKENRQRNIALAFIIIHSVYLLQLNSRSEVNRLLLKK